MKFEEERWIKIYTKDTANWLTLPWQSRTVFLFLLRKVDRHGDLDVGDTPIESLVALLCLPTEVVSVGLEGLVRRGTVTVVGGVLKTPKFEEAQQTPTCSTLRSQKHREIKKIEQACNAVQRDATDATNRTEENRTEQNKKQIYVEPSPDGGGSQAIPPDLAVCRLVFDHWANQQAELTGASLKSLKLTDERKRKIRARIREGYSVEDLCLAINGCFVTRFNVEKGFTELTLAIRDASHIDRFKVHAREGNHEGVPQTGQPGPPAATQSDFRLKLVRFEGKTA